jgi:serine/threonine protein kinase
MSLESLGRYRILGELGRGATGTVYRALDPLIERAVAVKTLNPDLPEDVLSEVRHRFMREARSAGRLSHPNLITIYDVGVEGEVAFIAMELLEGQSLQQMLRQQGRLSPARAADFAAQLADGLEHAHRHAIVHRDVKPANVMISPAGHAKLTDFGVAYIPSSSITQTGTAVGSPKYMSPEQVLGQAADPRSDIFSLGVVLYEMLVESTPFERAGEQVMFELMRRITMEPHRKITELDGAIPGQFDAILERALAKRPEERYQSAADMRQDLLRLTDGQAAADPRYGREDDATIVLQRPHASSGPAFGYGAMPDHTSSVLLAELDSFSRTFEDREQAYIQAEVEARRRKKKELSRWADAQARLREEYERERAVDDSRFVGAPGARRRSAAIDVLKKQAAMRVPEPSRAPKPEDIERIDRNLRATFRYFADFAREANSARPVAQHRYQLVYIGELPALTLREAFADFRMRRMGDRDVHDYVSLSCRLRAERKARIELAGQDMERFSRELEALQIESARKERRNIFGRVSRAEFTLGVIPCYVRVRADYDACEVSVEMRNIGRLGRTRQRFALEEFTEDVIDELGQYLLGLDRSFERRLEKS